MSTGQPSEPSLSSGLGHVSQTSTPTQHPSPNTEYTGSEPSQILKSWNHDNRLAMMDASEDAPNHASEPEEEQLVAKPVERQQQQGKPSRATSGGFLLNTPFHSVRQRKRVKRETREEDDNDRTYPRRQEVQSSADQSWEQTPQLDGEGSPHFSQLSKNGDAVDAIRVEKRRKRKGKEKDTESAPNSQASSSVAERSTSTRPATDNANTMDDAHWNTAQPSAVDPAAIVNMALSLNESRRLNLAPGRLASNPSPLGRRTTSARLDVPSPLLQGHWSDHRETLRRATQSRSASRNVSPALGSSPNQDSRPGSSSLPLPLLSGGLTSTALNQDFGYTFSAGTISRAEKARKFIELHDEYRRLLRNLPPLIPGADLGNVPSLGRPYNPLQYIRNRKIRGRERALLDPEGAGWDNSDEVKAWVDRTETEAKLESFRAGDIAILPPWNRAGNKGSEDAPESSSADISTAAIAGSKQKRPKLDWTFTPADLLADAYWLEQDTHKALIERHDGTKIFPGLQGPEEVGASPSNRQSYDRRSSYNDNPFTMMRPELKRSGTASPSTRRNSTSRDLGYGISAMMNNESNMSRVKRRLLPRRRTASTNASVSSLSDDDELEVPNDGKTSLGRTLGVNIGPLEKHMSNILKAELSRTATREASEPNDDIREEREQRRGGVSTEYYEHEPPHRPQSQDHKSLRSSLSSSHAQSPRISVDDVDGMRPRANGHPVSPLGGLSPTSAVNHSRTKPRSRPLHLFHRRGKSKQQNNIDENDFALSTDKTAQNLLSESPGSARSSLDQGARLLRRQPTPNLESAQEDAHRHSYDSSQANLDSETGPRSMRFFKGGRIGDIVRTERAYVPGFSRKKEKDSSRRGSPGKSSDHPSAKEALQGDLDSDQDRDVFAPVQPIRSRSADDLSQLPHYDAKHLPTFRSANAPPVSGPERQAGKISEDHISRQIQEQKQLKHRRKSRFGRLRPPNISTDSSTEVSPNTSAYDLSKVDTGPDSFRTGNSDASRSSAGVRVADQRLKRLLREPGGVGLGGLPVTGLAGLDARPAKGSQLSESHRPLSISDRPEGMDDEKEHAVTKKDINHVRALLLSSGVKAHSIVLRADEVCDPPSDYLSEAAKTAGASFSPVSRRQEHALAARLLSENLESSATAFDQAVDEFRNDTCHNLQVQIDDLRERVNSDLTPRIQSCGDDADAFIARLTTTHTLAVKQVNDSVDLMMRSRWRRLRLLRRAGFKMLEWMLVGLMWWIWLFVFVFKAVKGVVYGAVRGIRWLLWV